MSGVLGRNWRHGNLSEILADYLLSSMGIATVVRHQDDYGFDFYCQLSDQVTGPILTFGHPYIMQIKSDEKPIVYGKEKDEWKKEDITWINRLEWPLFIGVVDKAKISMNIYRTTNIWFPLYESREPSQIELNFDPIKEGEEIEKRKYTAISNWPPGKGDGQKWTVQTGNPIVTISPSDFEKGSIKLLQRKKDVLRQYIELEMRNITFRRLGIAHFQWVQNNKTNEHFTTTGVMFYGGAGDGHIDLYNALYPGLVSLLFQLTKHANGSDELNALKNLMSFLPQKDLFKQLKQQSRDIFDRVKD